MYNYVFKIVHKKQKKKITKKKLFKNTFLRINSQKLLFFKRSLNDILEPKNSSQTNSKYLNFFLMICLTCIKLQLGGSMLQLKFDDYIINQNQNWKQKKKRPNW